MSKTNHKAGYVTIFGLPNSGKSTLLNALLDFRLSIISARPQTTRRNVIGILNNDQMQSVFLDTPGVVQPKYELHKRMLLQIESAVNDADILMLISDASTQDHPASIDMKRMNKFNKKCILILNKIDLIDKRKILELINIYKEWYSFSSFLPISALKKDGMELIKQTIFDLLPESPPYFPKDQLTDQPERFFVAEIIREVVFHSFHEEIPYAVEVQIEEFKERSKGKDYISATIFVERDSQKGILIGNRGSKLKEVGQKSRLAIERFTTRPAYLQLNVQVNKSWRRNSGSLSRLGY